MDETSNTESEKAPLVKRAEFRPVSQPQDENPGVEICGINSPCLANVPIVKTIFKKKGPSQKVGDVTDTIPKCT